VPGRAEVGWRTLGTGVLAAVASGLIGGFFFASDRRKSPGPGLRGISAVVVAFVSEPVAAVEFKAVPRRLTIALTCAGLSAAPPAMFLPASYASS